MNVPWKTILILVGMLAMKGCSESMGSYFVLVNEPPAIIAEKPIKAKPVPAKQLDMSFKLEPINFGVSSLKGMMDEFSKDGRK